MEFSSVLHLAKSNMAYPLDKHNLLIWLRTKKKDVKEVKAFYGDPFALTHKEYTNTITLEKTYETEYHDYYKAILNSKTQRLAYYFELTDNDDNEYFYTSKDFTKKTNKMIVEDFFDFPFLCDEDILKTPDWAKKTVWYQIFIDRFYTTNPKLDWNTKEKVSNHDVFGGDLKGIIEKIPYLSSLGITGIYFTPLFEAESIHKYDTTDYYNIDKQFGSNKDFKELVEACHKSGIKVMLDIVFNHCGTKHKFYLDVLKNGSKSAYSNCFCYLDESKKELFIDGKCNFQCFSFYPGMPKLNHEEPIVRNYLLDVSAYWIKEYDVDGYRLDVSQAVSHMFWKEFHHLCKGLKKDFLIIGENWTDATSWINADEMDAVMNYSLFYPIKKYFIEKELNSREFTYHINNVITMYPKETLNTMFNLLSSHDIPRILYEAKGNKTIVKLAYLFLFTFPGSPCIYYGDEVSLNGAQDPENRRPMPWDNMDLDMLAFMKKLILTKKEYFNNPNDDIKWVKASTNENCIIYKRGNMTVIINNSDIPMDVDTSNVCGQALDVWNNKDVTITKTTHIKENSYIILQNK